MAIDYDAALKMDKDKLIAELDLEQPDWFVQFATLRGLENFARDSKHRDEQMCDRWVRRLKHDSLDNMLESFRLLGHAATVLATGAAIGSPDLPG